MAVRFVVDEDLPEAVAAFLRQMGYWAEHVRSVSLRGASDQEVFQNAQTREAVFVTADKEFSDIRRFPFFREALNIAADLCDESKLQRVLEQLLEVSR